MQEKAIVPCAMVRDSDHQISSPEERDGTVERPLILMRALFHLDL